MSRVEEIITYKNTEKWQCHYSCSFFRR